ncbi:hypothetical protein K443DRAFT_111434, partial [Laccaria amethystina LaAM-08-1]
KSKVVWITPPPSTSNVLTETVSSQWRTAVISRPCNVPRPLESSSCPVKRECLGERILAKAMFKHRGQSCQKAGATLRYQGNVA